MWDGISTQLEAARGRLRADADRGALRAFFLAATARSVARMLVRGPQRPGRAWRTQLLVDLSRDVGLAYGALPTPEARVLHGRIAFPFPPGVATERRIAGVRAVEVVDRADAERAAPRGRVVYLHGGGFTLGAPETHARLAVALARTSGATVLSLDYRLAPEHPHPAAIDDLDAVLDAIAAEDGGLHACALAGDSAGGTIALSTLQRRRDRGAPLPVAAAVISPNVDLGLTAPSIDANGPGDYLSRAQLERLVRSYVGDRDRGDPSISPIRASFAGLPPLLVHAAEDEVLRDDAVALHARAVEDGVACALRLHAALFHDFHTAQEQLVEAREATAEIGAFLRGHLDAHAAARAAPPPPIAGAAR